ncbi:hypothetical protein COY07_06150, partial [Candidatus Peregrinibacteria bacterium CG_4_10_14_0_2_um_filter_43_11]
FATLQRLLAEDADPSVIQPLAQDAIHKATDVTLLMTIGDRIAGVNSPTAVQAYEKALQRLESASFTASEVKAEAYCSLGERLKKGGQNTTSIQAYLKAIEHYPEGVENVKKCWRILQILKGLGCPQEKLVSETRLIADKTKTVKTLLIIAGTLNEKFSAPKEALEVYEKALGQNPDFRQLQHLLQAGITLYAQITNASLVVVAGKRWLKAATDADEIKDMGDALGDIPEAAEVRRAAYKRYAEMCTDPKVLLAFAQEYKDQPEWRDLAEEAIERAFERASNGGQGAVAILFIGKEAEAMGFSGLAAEHYTLLAESSESPDILVELLKRGEALQDPGLTDTATKHLMEHLWEEPQELIDFAEDSQKNPTRRALVVAALEKAFATSETADDTFGAGTIAEAMGLHEMTIQPYIAFAKATDEWTSALILFEKGRNLSTLGKGDAVTLAAGCRALNLATTPHQACVRIGHVFRSIEGAGEKWMTAYIKAFGFINNPQEILSYFERSYFHQDLLIDAGLNRLKALDSTPDSLVYFARLLVNNNQRIQGEKAMSEAFRRAGIDETAILEVGTAAQEMEFHEMVKGHYTDLAASTTAEATLSALLERAIVLCQTSHDPSLAVDVANHILKITNDLGHYVAVAEHLHLIAGEEGVSELKQRAYWHYVRNQSNPDALYAFALGHEEEEEIKLIVESAFDRLINTLWTTPKPLLDFAETHKTKPEWSKKAKAAAAKAIAYSTQEADLLVVGKRVEAMGYIALLTSPYTDLAAKTTSGDTVHALLKAGIRFINHGLIRAATDRLLVIGNLFDKTSVIAKILLRTVGIETNLITELLNKVMEGRQDVDELFFFEQDKNDDIYKQSALFGGAVLRRLEAVEGAQAKDYSRFAFYFEMHPALAKRAIEKVIEKTVGASPLSPVDSKSLETCYDMTGSNKWLELREKCAMRMAEGIVWDIEKTPYLEALKRGVLLGGEAEGHIQGILDHLKIIPKNPHIKTPENPPGITERSVTIVLIAPAEIEPGYRIAYAINMIAEHGDPIKKEDWELTPEMTAGQTVSVIVPVPGTLAIEAVSRSGVRGERLFDEVLLPPPEVRNCPGTSLLFPPGKAQGAVLFAVHPGTAQIECISEENVIGTQDVWGGRTSVLFTISAGQLIQCKARGTIKRPNGTAVGVAESILSEGVYGEAQIPRGFLAVAGSVWQTNISESVSVRAVTQDSDRDELSVFVSLDGGESFLPYEGSVGENGEVNIDGVFAPAVVCWKSHWKKQPEKETEPTALTVVKMPAPVAEGDRLIPVEGEDGMGTIIFRVPRGTQYVRLINGGGKNAPEAEGIPVTGDSVTLTVPLSSKAQIIAYSVIMGKEVESLPSAVIKSRSGSGRAHARTAIGPPTAGADIRAERTAPLYQALSRFSDARIGQKLSMSDIPIDGESRDLWFIVEKVSSSQEDSGGGQGVFFRLTVGIEERNEQVTVDVMPTHIRVIGNSPVITPIFKNGTTHNREFLESLSLF